MRISKQDSMNKYCPYELLKIFSLITISMLILTSYVLEIDNYASEDRDRFKVIIESETPVNWVFTGNSITQGAKHTHGMRSFPEIFAERVRWEMQRTSDYVINTGISGSTTLDILNDFDKRVTQFNPKVVVLMCGTNDAAEDRNISVDQYEANLIKLIQDIRKIEAIPVLVSPSIIILEKSPERSKLNQYVAKMKKITHHENVIFVDNWSIWSFDLQIKYNGKVNEILLNDPLHPNGFGHKEIAIALFKELAIFDPTAATCGGKYYEGMH